MGKPSPCVMASVPARWRQMLQPGGVPAGVVCGPFKNRVRRHARRGCQYGSQRVADIPFKTTIKNNPGKSHSSNQLSSPP